MRIAIAPIVRMGGYWLRIQARIYAARTRRSATATIAVSASLCRAIARGSRAWLGILSLVIWGTGFIAANRLTRGAVDWVTGWRWRWLGWAEFVVQHAPDADVWHGHDFTSLPAIIALKRARGGIAIYDSHEIYLESGRNAGQPRWAKGQLERLERRLTREVDAVLTVNDSLAAILADRLGIGHVGVLYNCPARYASADSGSRLRDTLGLDASTPLALYHGSLAEHRGIEQLLLAIVDPSIEDVHVVFLGHGPLLPWLRDQASGSRYRGRVHVLDGVPPHELLSWIAGVDVAVVPIQPSTMNHVYSSPNKVFEAIAVGTPVAGSDFPEFRKVVLAEPDGPLGVLFDPTDPSEIAAAIRELTSLAPHARDTLRARCFRAATRQWNWETESRELTDLYHRFEVERAASLAA